MDKNPPGKLSFWTSVSIEQLSYWTSVLFDKCLLDQKVLDKCPIGHVSVGTMSHHPWEPVEPWQVAPYFLKYSIISNLQVYVKKVISTTSTPLLEGPYALICDIFSL